MEKGVKKFQFNPFGRIARALSLGWLFLPLWMLDAEVRGSTLFFSVGVLATIFLSVVTIVAIRDWRRPRWITVDELGLEVPGRIWGCHRFEFAYMGGAKMGLSRDGQRILLLREGTDRKALTAEVLGQRADFPELCDIVRDRVEIATRRPPE